MGKDDGYLWTYSEGDDGQPVVWTTSMKEAKRRAKREQKQTEKRFRRAPFPLYGLPATWEGGGRFLGGHEHGGWAGRERTHSLSLLHGVQAVGDGPMLDVETATPSACAGGGGLRILAEDVWAGRAPDLQGAAEALAERWDRPVEEASATRTNASVVIEGTAVTFDVFFQQDRWVGRAMLDDLVLTLEGAPFERHGLELVRITDLEPYIQGSRRGPP